MDEEGDLFICPVCLEDIVSKDPRMLSCNHAFCSPCLRMLEQYSRIKCPKCRKTTNLGRTGILSLPVDFNIKKMKDFEKEITSKADSFCTACIRRQIRRKAKSLCMDCMRKFCPDCLSAHNAIPALKGHLMVFMDQANTQNLPICEKHKEKLRYACFTCREALCVDCSTGEAHTTHKDQVVTIEESIQTYWAEMTEMKGMIAETTSAIEVALPELKFYLEEIKVQEKRLHNVKSDLQEKLEEINKYLQLLETYRRPISNSHHLLSKNKQELRNSLEEIMKLKDTSDLVPILTIMLRKNGRMRDTIKRSKERFKQVYEIPVFNPSDSYVPGPIGELNVKLKVHQLGSVKTKPFVRNVSSPKRSDGEVLIDTSRACAAVSLVNKEDPQVSSRKHLRKMKLAWEIGNTESCSVKFGFPASLLIYDKEECIIVADSLQNILHRFDLAGNHQAAFATSLKDNIHCASIFDDNIFVVQYTTITVLPVYLERFEGETTLCPYVSQIEDIAVVHRDCLLLICESKIMEYTPSTNVTKAVVYHLDNPTNITVCRKNGFVKYAVTEAGFSKYVRIYNDHWVLMATIAGPTGVSDVLSPFRKVTGFDAKTGRFAWPRGTVYLPHTDTLLVADSDQHLISEFKLDGTFIKHVLSGSDGLLYPVSLGYSDGKLVVGQSGNPASIKLFSI